MFIRINGDNMKKNIVIVFLILVVIILVGFIYYKKAYYHFELNGEKEIILINGEEYIEPGYIFVDYNNNNLKNNVREESTIDINTAGEYEIKYFFGDKLLDTRKVIVKKMTFKLNGEEIVYVDLNLENNKYQELGFIAEDSNGVDFSNHVSIIGNVNDNETGVYEIKYVLKIDDFEKTLIRKVYVEKFINELSLNEDNVSMYVNDTKELIASYNPYEVTNKDLFWSSSDDNIVTVNNGSIVAKHEGTAIISVKTINNIESKCMVNVSKKKDVININYQKIAITSEKKEAIITNLSGIDMNITYYSDDKCQDKIEGLIPNEIGTYYVIVDSLGNDEYMDSSVSCTKALTITKEPVTIRVGTFNIGQYKCGTGSVSCKITYKDFSNEFKKMNVDIVGVQEAEPSSQTQKAAINAGLTSTYFKTPASTVGILSKYALNNTSSTSLKKCRESRVIEKAIVNINGVNISVYNTHFSPKCYNEHFSSIVSIIKKDLNPAILMGDFNIGSGTELYEKYLKPLGYEIASMNEKHSGIEGKISYCDSIYIKSNDHIDIIGRETDLTYKRLSDHNFIIATLNIY